MFQWIEAIDCYKITYKPLHGKEASAFPDVGTTKQGVKYVYDGSLKKILDNADKSPVTSLYTSS
jgi:hypothetical protein